MLSEEKLDDIFAGFLQAGMRQEGQDIKQLYEVLPYLRSDQQRVLVLYRSLAVKYNSPVLHEIVLAIESYAKTNRKLGVSWARNLSSYSLMKFFKGMSSSVRPPGQNSGGDN